MSSSFSMPSYYNGSFSELGYQFLANIAKPYSQQAKECVIFAVMHCYDGTLPYIYALADNCSKLVIVPKQSTMKNNQHVVESLASFPQCVIADRGINKLSLNDNGICEQFIEQHTQGAPFILLDHGGYFAQASAHLADCFGKQFFGAAELTANGYYKYEKVELKTPVVSVSHISIKKPADYEAAECIVHYCDHVVREQFGAKLNNSGFYNIGVVGAGNLGLGIVKYLQGKGISNLQVSDADPRKLTMLTRDGISVRSIKQLVSDCNFIFCATGNKSIPSELYRYLQPHSVITTVTSADDELGLPSLIEHGHITLKNETPWLCEYQSESGNPFYLLAGGDSVNTLFKTGMGDPTVYLFEAAHTLAGLQLLSPSSQWKPGLHKIDELNERMIAIEWLHHFYDYQ
ncbi:NAD(P)-binding domain-containing protein [Vibrio sp. WXL210]|uniref:NAD(P)-binding domain-containing protein n=1 Tax=Vibrio sp. WXL210 TaxID=3450709 RepID=UPI003EC4BC14